MLTLMKRFNIRNSIQAKIFVSFSLVMFLTILLVTFNAYYNSSELINKNAISHVNNSIIHADENLQIMLEDIDKISSVLVSDKNLVSSHINSEHYPISYEWFEEKKATEQLLNSMMAFKPYISQISIVGLSGKVFQTDNHRTGSDLLDRLPLEEIISGKKKVFLHGVSDNNNVSLARPIFDRGHPIGIALIDFNLQIIQEVYNIMQHIDTMVLIINDEGRIIHSTEKQWINYNINDSDYGGVRIPAAALNQSPNEIEAYGKTYLLVSHKSDYTGWTTMGMFPKKKLLSEVYSMRNQLLNIAGIALLSGFMISLLISRKITFNLNRLNNAMKMVGKGYLTARPTIHSSDEIGQLSNRFTSMMDQLSQLMSDLEEEHAKKRKAELMALQSQIKPHFLYNTLNTIKHLANIQHIRNIEEVTVALIVLLRAVVDDTNEMISIRNEVEYVKQYLIIQEYKYPGKFEIAYQIEHDVLDYRMPKLILQPIIENALLHGIGNIQRKGLIQIKIYRYQNDVIFEITDNGSGISEAELQRVFGQQKTDEQGIPLTDGIGLKNVDDRIKIMYGSRYGISVCSEMDMFTTVEITLPVIKGDHDAESTVG